jgi:hypothetical protein
VSSVAGFTDAVPATLTALGAPGTSTVLRGINLNTAGADTCVAHSIGDAYNLNNLGWDAITERPLRGTTERWFIKRCAPVDACAKAPDAVQCAGARRL